MLEIENLAVTVGQGDTFDIPFVINNHIMTSYEKFVFTIRKQVPTRSRLLEGKQGEILFQKEISIKDTIAIRNEKEEIIGCSFLVSALDAEAKKIPLGQHLYDLALINESAGIKFEVIIPSVFNNVEVLRNV